MLLVFSIKLFLQNLLCLLFFLVAGEFKNASPKNSSRFFQNHELYRGAFKT